MTFKSATQPLCRFCGRPLKKWTDTFYVHATPPATEAPETTFGAPGTPEQFKRIPTGRMTKIHVDPYIVGAPKTRAEAQTLINMKIASVRKNSDGIITRVTVWDGESYEDGFFCSNDHAIKYAYHAVQSKHNAMIMVAYRDARDKASAAVTLEDK